MNSFAKFLPSKSFLAVGAALLFSVALVTGIFKLTHREVTQNELPIPTLSTNDALVATIQKSISEKDTDQDGLKDWEEALWGTDPNNKDTDGDGTTDGDEVASGRNPTQRGPNDKYVTPLETATAGVVASSDNLTATDIVSRDLFSKYLEAKQNNQDLDQNTENQIVASVISRGTQASAEVRQYTEGELIVSSDSSKDALHAYGNEMGGIIKENLKQNEPEVDIFGRAVQQNKKEELSKLSPIIQNYKNILNASLKISVPAKAVDTHLSFINAVSKIVTSLEAMQNVFQDPVTAMTFFGTYTDTMTKLQLAFGGARDLFVRNNIAFDGSRENGNYFARYADAIEYVQKQLQKQKS